MRSYCSLCSTFKHIPGVDLSKCGSKGADALHSFARSASVPQDSKHLLSLLIARIQRELKTKSPRHQVNISLTATNHQPPTHPSASLLGLPIPVELEILLKVGDLPSLRPLKLASRDYYIVAKIFPRQLQRAYADDIAARDPANRQIPPWAHPHARQQSFARQPRRRSDWLHQFDEALFQAARDWAALDIKRGSRHVLDGQEAFDFTKTQYMSARMYNLTGEHILRGQINMHVYFIKALYLKNCKKSSGAYLDESDLEYEDEFSTLFDVREIAKVLERVRRKRHAQKMVIEDRLLNLLTYKRQLTSTILQSLERDGELVCEEGGYWRLRKPDEKQSTT